MSVKDKANEAKAKVGEKANDVADGARRGYESARTKAVNAYGSAKDGARTGARKTGEGIESNPFIALAAGLGLGAIIGALIPRSRREKELLRDVGRDLNTRAHGAYGAAKDAGQRQLEERGLTPEAAENAVRDVARGVSEAAKQSASAAASAAKNKDA
ncbi:hypothetical protein WJS89_01940 [Sphingomicrobium sp. XHP0235]|uniref:hypothetical protein n=1 Tax=Sphingomicrobium aquimarinum TaxID=3133971 RepID=UPI0031FE703F